MILNPNKPLFITGTDTDIGKTFVSSILIAGLGWNYFKPIQSGNPSDLSWIQSHLPEAKTTPSLYHFSEPKSPNQAAEIDGVKINYSSIISKTPRLRTLVEGAGGLMVPICDDKTFLNYAIDIEAQIIVVASSKLGTLNHSILTALALKNTQANFLGFVLNGPSHPENKRDIELYSKAKVIAEVPNLDNYDIKNKLGSNDRQLKQLFKTYFCLKYPKDKDSEIMILNNKIINNNIPNNMPYITKQLLPKEIS